MAKFSLKRVLVSIGVILALAGVGVLALNRIAQHDVERVATSPQVVSRAIITAVQMRQAQQAGCPTVQQLRDEQFLDAAFVLDQWGSPYIVRCASGAIEVQSLGADRTHGTPDDIIVKGP